MVFQAPRQPDPTQSEPATLKPFNGPDRAEHQPAASWRRSLRTCGASLPSLQPSIMVLRPTIAPDNFQLQATLNWTCSEGADASNHEG